MKSQVLQLSMSIMALLLASCAVQVKTFKKPEVDYSEFESWCWMQGCEATYQGPEYYYDEKVFDEIANAIAWNMSDKGYLQSDQTSDLVVNFYVIMEEDSTQVEYPDYLSIEQNISWLDVLHPEYYRYLRGTLVIDVLSRKDSELIWSSKAMKYLETTPKVDKKEIWSNIHKAMKKLPNRQ